MSKKKNIGMVRYEEKALEDDCAFVFKLIAIIYHTGRGLPILGYTLIVSKFRTMEII